MANERKAQLLFNELLAGLNDSVKNAYNEQRDIYKNISLSRDDELYKNVCILSTVIINDMLSKGEDIDGYMHEIESELNGNKILIADDIDTLSPGLLELIKNKNNIISRYLEVHKVELRLTNDFIDSVIELYAIYFKIDIEDDMDELDDDMKFDIDNDVRQIMSIYDIIYAPLFEMEPVGMLTSNGVIYIDNDLNIKVKSTGKRNAVIVFNKINEHYSGAIKELEYTEIVNINNCINSDGSLKINYIPGFHVKNIFGIVTGKNGVERKVKKWSEFRRLLQKSLRRKITEIIKNFCSDRSKDELSKANLARNLVELFTTVFITEEFDNKSFKLTSKSVALGEKLADIGNLVTSGEMFPSYDSSLIKLVDNSEIKQGVFGLLTIFDVAAYNGEILFAYKAIQKILESGGSISLNKTLLGKDIRGRNVTYNFEGASNTNSLIIAGSGSGKGVMTLNILATFIACGCPTVYIDWKPDMSAMLWELERQTGAKILAIDGAVGRKEGGIVPVRNYGTGVNAPNIAGITEKLNVIPYLKMVQIMTLCAVARSSGYNGMSKKGAKMQFILDEAQQMNNALRKLGKAIDNYLKANKPSKTNPKTPEYEYVEKINNLIAGISSSIEGFKNTFGRQGNVGLLMLGQQADASAWSDGNMKRDTMGYLVGNCTMKLLGRGATDSTKYNLGDAAPVGKELLGNMGYFALVEGNLANKSMNIPVVKSYLVLNDNDYNPSDPGAFTSDLLKNITDDTIKQSVIENDLYPNGVVNEKAGFRGLMQYMGSKISNFDLNKNLELGYRTVEQLLKGLGILGTGKYADIESYVFDLSPDAIYTTEYLERLIQSGGKVNNGGEINTDNSDNNADGEFNVYDEDMYCCQTCGYEASEPISTPCPRCGGDPSLSEGTWTCFNCGKHPISTALGACPDCHAWRGYGSSDTGGSEYTDTNEERFNADSKDDESKDTDTNERWYDDDSKDTDTNERWYDDDSKDTDTNEYWSDDESKDTDTNERWYDDDSKDNEGGEDSNTGNTGGNVPPISNSTPFGNTGGIGNTGGNVPPISNPMPFGNTGGIGNAGGNVPPISNPTPFGNTGGNVPPILNPTPFSHSEASTYNDTPDNSYTPEYDADILFKDDGKYHTFSSNAMERAMSSNILEIIKEYFGDLGIVHTISIENGGHILANGVHINPTFNINADNNNVPPYIANKLGSGQWGEFLHGTDLLKFKSLSVLKIDGMNIVNKYCRELGVSDAFKLKKKIGKKTGLMEFYIDGKLVSEEGREYIEDADRGANFAEGVRNAYNRVTGIGSALASACSTIHNSKVWNGGVGKFVRGVATVGGVAVGLPILSGIITGLGFLGTLNLAIACAGGVYNVVRKRKVKNSGITGD